MFINTFKNYLLIIYCFYIFKIELYQYFYEYYSNQYQYQKILKFIICFIYLVVEM